MTKSHFYKLNTKKYDANKIPIFLILEKYYFSYNKRRIIFFFINKTFIFHKSLHKDSLFAVLKNDEFQILFSIWKYDFHTFEIKKLITIHVA